MKRKPIIFAAFALGAMTAFAQINSPQSAGYETRAAAMLADGNFQGCIDQCGIALDLGSNKREQLLWLSAVAAFNGGFPDAGKRVNAFIRQFPNSQHYLSARLMAATLVFYDGNYQKALKEFEKINPSSLNASEAEDLTYRKAYSQMQMGEFDAARGLYADLLDTKRYADAATFYLGYIDFSEGNYEQALEQFEKCDKTSSPGNMADCYVGQILFKRKDYSAALNLLRPAVAQTKLPADFKDECERVIGECFYALHDDNRAMVYLNEYMLNHAGEAPLSTRYIVGVERYQTGDYQDAIDLLAPVSRLTDEMGQSASLTMGQAYQAMGNGKSAMMLFDKATRMDFNPRLTEMAYYNYAVTQVDGGRLPFGNSIQTLEDFLHRYPESRYAESVREYLVKGYMATDDYSGALRSLNAMSDNHSATMDAARQRVNFVLGSRALQSGDVAMSINYLTEAMKYGNFDAEIEKQTSLWLGDAYYAQGDYAKAATEYKSYLASTTAKDPNRRLAQYNLGYAEFAVREYKDARKMFEQVVADRKTTTDIKQDSYNRIADTYYYDKDFSTAKNIYRKALDTKPTSGDYSLMQIAMMQGHLGDYAGKVKTLEKLIDSYSSPLEAAAATEMAMTLGLQGKLDDAAALYERISIGYAGTQYARNAMLQVAIISDNKGDTQAAKEFYRQLIKLYPTSPEAVLAVQDLKRIYAHEGNIMELDSYLTSIKDAPQLDATERNAIAAASMLAKAKAATSADSRLAAAEALLKDYPHAAEAEEAQAIAAKAYADKNIPGKALERYTLLEQMATSASMRHTARIGILRAANELGDTKRVLTVTRELLDNPATTGVDLPEVEFTRALALAKSNDSDGAITIWKELAKEPSGLYGTRSAYELANHYFTTGNLDIANRTAEALIDANPPHAYWLARTFILFSDILREQGSDFEADEYLRVLRSNYPGTESDIFQMIDKRLPQ